MALTKKERDKIKSQSGLTASVNASKNEEAYYKSHYGEKPHSTYLGDKYQTQEDIDQAARDAALSQLNPKFGTSKLDLANSNGAISAIKKANTISPKTSTMDMIGSNNATTAYHNYQKAKLEKKLGQTTYNNLQQRDVKTNTPSAGASNTLMGIANDVARKNVGNVTTALKTTDLSDTYVGANKFNNETLLDKNKKYSSTQEAVYDKAYDKYTSVPNKARADLERVFNTPNYSTNDKTKIANQYLVETYGMDKDEAAAYVDNYQNYKDIVENGNQYNNFKRETDNYSAKEKELLKSYIDQGEERKISSEASKMRLAKQRKEIASQLKELGWTDDQIDEAAKKYKVVLDTDAYYEKARQQQQNINDSNLSLLGYNLKDVATFLPAAAQGLTETIRQKTGQQYINPYSSGYGLLNEANVTEQSTSEKIGNKYGQFAYGVGMSTAKSLEAMLVGSGVAGGLGLSGAAAKVAASALTLPAFGSAAYQSSLKEGVERGLGTEKASQYALASGLNEMAFELISLDKAYDLLKQGGKELLAKGFKSAIKDAVVQAGIEGSEEGFTDLANWLADDMINKEFSEYNQLVEEVGEEEARKQFGKELLTDVLAGAASGGLTGGATVGISYVNAKNTANTVLSNDNATETVVNEALKMNPESKARQIAEEVKANNARPTTNQMIDMLASASGEESTTNAIKSALVESGISEDAVDESLANISVASFTDDDSNLNNEEKTVLNDINEGKYESNVAAEKIGQSVRSAIEVKEQQKKAAKEEARQDAMLRKGLKSTEFANDEQRKFEIKNLANTFHDKEAADIFVKNYAGQDKEAYLTLTTKALNAGQVFGDTLTASEYINSKSVRPYVAIDDANLQPVLEMYDRGKAIRQAELQVERGEAKKFTGNADILGTVDDSKVRDKTSETYKVMKPLAEAIAKKRNIAIELTDDFVENANASFTSSIAKMTINMNANDSATNSFHETGEFMKAYNPEGMNEVTNAVLSYASQMDSKSLDNIVNQVIAYRDAYRNSGIESESNKTISQATDEFIFDATATILTSKANAENFIEFLKDNYSNEESTSIIQKLRDLFNSIVEYLKNAISNNPGHKLGREIASTNVKKAQEIAEIWNDAVEGATAELNRQVSERASKNESNEEADKVYSKLKAKVDTLEKKHSIEIDEPIEKTKELIAVHNLTESKLVKTLQLEGIPMPSIAITKASLGWSNFGDISYVFGLDTINPKNKKNKIYAADAWTPTFPTVDIKLDSKTTNKITEMLYSISGKIPDDMYNRANSFTSSLEEKIKYAGVDGLIQEAKDNYGMKALYLAGVDGKEIESKYTEVREEADPRSVEMSKWILDNFDFNEIDNMSFDEMLDKVGKEIVKHVNEIRSKEVEDFKPLDPENIANSRIQLNLVRNRLNAAREYEKNNGVKIRTVEDYDAEKAYVNENIDFNNYDKWLHKMFDNIVEKEGVYNGKEIFTSSGNRRTFEQLHLSVTAQNIVKSMLTQSADARNVSGFHGAKSVRAVAVDEIKTLEELRKASDKIKNIDVDEYNQLNDNIEKRLSNVISEIQETSSKKGRSTGNAFIDMDSIGESILEVAYKNDVDEIYNKLNGYNWVTSKAQAEEISSIISDIKDMPVNMFEAKPQRVVDFKEGTLIIPDNVKQSTKSLIEDKGIQYFEYEAGNEEARKTIMNNMNDKRFSVDISTDDNSSITIDSEGKTLSPSQKEYFKDSKVVDENGNLKVMYHGTDEANFTVFDPSMSDDGISLFFTDNRFVANTYSTADLNIINPYDLPTKVESESDLKNRFEGSDWTVSKDGGKYIISNTDEEFETVEGDTPSKAYENWFDIFGWGDIEDEMAGIYPVYINAENPYIIDAKGKKWNELGDDFESTTREYAEYAKENGYDSLIIKNVDDIGAYANRGTSIKSEVVVAFSPNQIKSTFNENPTSDNDIRYSVDVDDVWESIMQEELEKPLSIIERGAANVKNANLDAKAVNKIAKDIIESTQSNYKTKELSDKLMKSFAYMHDNDVKYNDMLDVIRDIATPVIEQSGRINEAEKADYDRMREYLRKTKIALTDVQRREVASVYGSLSAYRDAMFGYAAFSNSGTTLDQLWSEVVNASGNRLEAGASEGDMPVLLEELMQSLKPGMVNDFGMDSEHAAYDLALDIYRKYFQMMGENKAGTDLIKAQQDYRKQVAEKYRQEYGKALADVKRKHNEEIQALQNQIAAYETEVAAANVERDKLRVAEYQAEIRKLHTRINRIKWQSDDKIAKIKAKNATSRRNIAKRKANTDLKNKLKSSVNQLNKMLKSPNVNDHIKQSLVMPTIEVLEAINLDTGKSRLMSEKLEKLREMYAAYKSDSTFDVDYDPRTYDIIEELKNMFYKRNYTELSNDELRQVLGLVKQLQTQITNANKILQSEKMHDAYESARNIISDIERGRGLNNNFTKGLNRYAIEHLNAKREFRKLSNYNDNSDLMALYEQLDKGQLVSLSTLREINQLFDEILVGKENQKEARRLSSTKPEDLVDIGLKDSNGNPILVTRGMRLSLIMHSRNDSNMNHILGGGFTVPDLKEYYKGKKANAYADGDIYRYVGRDVYLDSYKNDNPAMLDAAKDKEYRKIKAIYNELSDWEKAYLKAAETMFYDVSGKKVNEVSNTLKGYSIARVKNYFPIKTDKNFTKTDISGLVMDGTIEGRGSWKERIKATNPIYLEDITDVILRHAKDVSDYVGLAIPIRNANMLLNVQTYDQNNKKKSIRQTIEDVYSPSDLKYIEDLLADLQGGKKKEDSIFSDFFNGMRGRFAGATLTANVGVAMKQAASFPTAAAVLGWMPLAKTLATFEPGRTNVDGKLAIRTGIKELEDINPLLWYRNQGNSTEELGDLNKSGITKRLPKGLKAISVDLIQNVDSATIRALEYASKYYVDSNFKNLKKGSDEYWQKVSETFTRVVEETQPNYTVLQRPKMLRTSNELLKQVFMFKTQPLQNFGIMYDAVGELAAKARQYNLNKTESNKAELNSAIVNVSKAISSQIVAAMVFSAMTILSNYAYHKWWKYDQDDDKSRKQEMWQAFLSGTFSTLSGAVLAGDWAYNALDSMFTGAKNYGVSVSTIEMINDLSSAMTSLKENNSKLWEAKTTSDRLKASVNIRNAVDDLAQVFAQYTGVPYSNAKNTVESVMMYAMDFTTDAKIGESDIVEYRYASDVPTQRNMMIAAFFTDDKEYNKLRKEFISASSSANPEDSADSAVKSKLNEMYKANEIDLDEYEAYLKKLGISDKKIQSDVTKKLKEQYTEGDISRSEYKAELADEGVENVNAKMVDYIKDDYMNGKINRSEADKQLKAEGYDSEKVAEYLNKWDYAMNHNGSTDGYSKYYKLDDILTKQDVSQAILDQYVAQGATKENLKKHISSWYHEYVKKHGKNADVQARVLNAYQKLGYSRAKELENLKNWYKKNNY